MAAGSWGSSMVCRLNESPVTLFFRSMLSIIFVSSRRFSTFYSLYLTTVDSISLSVSLLPASSNSAKIAKSPQISMCYFLRVKLLSFFRRSASEEGDAEVVEGKGLIGSLD